MIGRRRFAARYVRRSWRETVLYSVRHSVITDAISAGADVLTVARISGTSLQMIQRFYGHLVEDKERARRWRNSRNHPETEKSLSRSSRTLVRAALVVLARPHVFPVPAL
jgi:hypothetical protein